MGAVDSLSTASAELPTPPPAYNAADLPRQHILDRPDSLGLFSKPSPACAMSRSGNLPASQSAQSVRRMPPSTSATSLAFPQSATVHNLAPGHGAQMRSSRTWTTSSGDFGLLSDTDQVDDRGVFVQEYNRLAKKHGVRLLVVEDFYPTQRAEHSDKRGWLSRILRTASHSPPAQARIPAPPRSRPAARHKRSVSDLALNLVHARREPPKSMDIQAMVRVSGKSVLYLPSEYAPGALVLPTCLRATAQHLSQNITTRGIFRIPGSVKVVNALFDYYCYMEDGGADIAGTVRCANLPMHIRSSVHDIASTFKRLLSVLPGGILGSLAVFDSFVAIHSHLSGDPEFPRTKRTKVRARLIALAVGSIQSQFRREVICAVFGLLSLIGRVAEVTPREDEDRRPLPTADLMGYGALGIVFGPLLVGDLLTQYSTRVATPASGLLLFPLTPQKLRRENRRTRNDGGSAPRNMAVDKILVANEITEMLIANWRDVVRQMKALGIHHRKDAPSVQVPVESARPSTAEGFTIKKPQDWSQLRTSKSADPIRREGSPEPDTPTMGMKRQRPRPRKSASSNRLTRPSVGALSPTAEESGVDDKGIHAKRAFERPSTRPGGPTHDNEPTSRGEAPRQEFEWSTGENYRDESMNEEPGPGWLPRERKDRSIPQSPRVAPNDVPPRTSSKQRSHQAHSMSRHAGPSSSGDDVSHRPMTKSLLSPEPTRGRCSTRPSKSNLKESVASSRSRRSTNAAPRSSRSSSARPHQTSQVSDLSFPAARQALEEKIDIPHRYTVYPNSEVSEVLSEELSSLMDELGAEARRESERSPSGTAAETPAHTRHEEDYFFPAKNGSIQNQPDTAAPGPTANSSIDVTPSQFYSPMRVPPNLSGPIASESASSLALDDEPLRREKGQPRSHGLSEQRLRQFDAPFTGTGPRNMTAKSPGHSDVSSIRPSVSEAASKRGAVKAMAARFEGPGPAEATSSRPKLGGREQSYMSSRSGMQAPRSIRTSRSGPLRTPQSAQAQPQVSQSQPPRKSVSGPSPQNEAARQKLRTSISDNVALKAASIKDAEKKQAVNDRPPLITLRQAAAAKRSVPEQSPKKAVREAPSMGHLGTMLPPQEQPPIAQHLTLPRPTSSASVIGPEPDNSSSSNLSLAGSAVTARPRSTSGLHSQIRNLQRQLDARTDEAAQLRRQLEAQQGSDVGTLSEQLREAKREAVVWKDRAEAAERRVKVFERFTARLRGIREAAAVADEQSPGMEEATTEPSEKSVSDGYFDEDEISPNQHVRFSGEGRVKDTPERSDDSGATEDAGVVSARIRKCLHAGPASGNAFGGDGATSPTMRARDVSQSAAEIWMAAQELLSMDGG